jgi:putative chitinase
MLTLEILQSLWPHGDQHIPGLLEAIASQAPDVFAKYGLNDDLTIAHAMAQFSLECGAGLTMIENLNYSEQGLLTTFPSHFTGTMAATYARNPQMIADVAYGGRMGNAPPPSDDGWNFRGRGFSQVTGRRGYEELATTTGLDLVNHPELVIDPQFALECGVADFVQCGCLPYAQNDDVHGVTKALNGGLNGYPERQAWLVKWKAALGVPDASSQSAQTPQPSPGQLVAP